MGKICASGTVGDYGYQLTWCHSKLFKVPIACEIMVICENGVHLRCVTG